MSSLAEYIEWYADFTFYDKPFNDVDNFVLSMLAYYSFDLKRDGGRPMMLRRCVTNSASKDSFLRAAIHSKRFGSLMVSHYQEIFNRDTTTQFGAMMFHLYDNVYFIAFRGTDMSLVGWREDFVISYKLTEGQQQAVKYLEEVIEDDKQYIVGGHSKGGHLALYGCSHISDAKRARITHIYNNDGPGLCPEVSDVSRIETIRDRVTMYVPQYCVFGKIFDHHFADMHIVTSSYEGINEHDIVSWEVTYGKPNIVKDYNADSLWINDITEDWLSDVDPTERESLVNTLFDAMEARGVEKYTEVFETGFEGLEDVIKKIIRTDNVETVAKIPEKALFGSWPQRLREGKLAKFINANQLIEGAVFTVVGLLMIIVPQWAFHIIITVLIGGVLVFQLIHTARRLYKSSWNFERERMRFYILAILATIFSIVLVKHQAMAVFGSGIAGGWLLVTAYKSFLAVKKSQKHDFLFFKNFVKTVLYACCGIMIVFVPSEFLVWMVLVLGGLMVIDGVCTIIYSIIRANEKYSQVYSNVKDKVKIKKKG